MITVTAMMMLMTSKDDDDDKDDADDADDDDERTNGRRPFRPILARPCMPYRDRARSSEGGWMFASDGCWNAWHGRLDAWMCMDA